MGTVKVAAMMTAARYEATWARNQIERAVKYLGIPLTISGGVYYGQCMQKMMEQAVETDTDYIVTIDGDSIFTSDNLERLISIIDQENDIDALASLQVRRGKADMLGTASGKREMKWNGYPVKVDTAHFGLTVIDIAKLRETPKPWFFAQPDENGSWDGDKVDDDVWFWHQWGKAGNSLYIDPGCRIGHLEEVISIFDENLKPIHMYPSEWSQ